MSYESLPRLNVGALGSLSFEGTPTKTDFKSGYVGVGVGVGAGLALNWVFRANFSIPIGKEKPVDSK